MDGKEIQDTLKAAHDHLTLLKSVDTQLQKAVFQILETKEDAEIFIKKIFSKLKNDLINILNEREKYLLEEIIKIKSRYLSPLEESRTLISKEIESTKTLINSGQLIIKNKTVDNLDAFSRNASLLGRVPEVPELKDVPFISFCYERSVETEVKDVLMNLGNVYGIPPIQITGLGEKPGAILVEWQNVNCDEKTVDIQEYRLQRAFGDVTKDEHLIVNFQDCYIGLDNQFLVKELQPNQHYSFRICGKFEGSTEWCPWSLPQVSSTNFKPFSWKDNQNYILSNENKIATPCIENSSVICSDGPQFFLGNSIEFTFLEIDSQGATVGLVHGGLDDCIKELSAFKSTSFLLNQNGQIFIDGCEKLTVLPKFSKGMKVCFSSEPVDRENIRIHVDSEDKRVSYNWSISPDTKISFIAHFASSKWKIMVE